MVSFLKIETHRAICRCMAESKDFTNLLTLRLVNREFLNIVNMVLRETFGTGESIGRSCFLSVYDCMCCNETRKDIRMLNEACTLNRDRKSVV